MRVEQTAPYPPTKVRQTHRLRNILEAAIFSLPLLGVPVHSLIAAPVSFPNASLKIATLKSPHIRLAEWLAEFGFKIPFGGPNDGPSFYGRLAGSTPDVKKKGNGEIKNYGNFENLEMRGEVDVKTPLHGNAPPQIELRNFPEKNLGRKGIPQRPQ
jgi:hypothetical protein